MQYFSHFIQCFLLSSSYKLVSLQRGFTLMSTLEVFISFHTFVIEWDFYGEKETYSVPWTVHWFLWFTGQTHWTSFYSTYWTYWCCLDGEAPVPAQRYYFSRCFWDWFLQCGLNLLSCWEWSLDADANEQLLYFPASFQAFVHIKRIRVAPILSTNPSCF